MFFLSYRCLSYVSYADVLMFVNNAWYLLKVENKQPGVINLNFNFQHCVTVIVSSACTNRPVLHTMYMLVEFIERPACTQYMSASCYFMLLVKFMHIKTILTRTFEVDIISSLLPKAKH